MTDYASNTELRTAFIGLAQWVWTSMGDAHRLGLSFNEETITESILLSLAREFSHRGLSIKSFNKYEEGTAFAGGPPTGADWEFWFTDPTGQWIGIRIQAKRLYLDTGRYGGLDGAGSQIMDLVNNSGSAIPLYVFYNGPTQSAIFPSQIDPTHRHCLHCGWPFLLRELWGCSLAMPDAVLQLLHPAPWEIKPMLPWHVIWCEHGNVQSPRRPPGALTNQLGRGLRRLYNRSRRLARRLHGGLDYWSAEKFQPIQRPPPWINQLDEGRAPEFLPEGVAGIAIIRDERKGKAS